MDVILRFHRQAVVDHVGNRWHVDSARGNVSGDQHFDGAIAQRFQTTRTNHLWHRAVQAGSRVTRAAQLVGQLVGFNLRSGENQRLIHRLVLQIMLKNRVLVRHVVIPMQTLLDVLVRVLGGGQLDSFRAAHHGGGKLHHAWREGCREHHRAFATLRGNVNRLQIFREAEVQHAVSFINDERLHAVEIDLAIAVQVKQTTWRCDDQVRATKVHQLFAKSGAADDVRDANAAYEAHQADRLFSDLRCEFACWAKYEYAGRCASAMFACSLLALGHRWGFEQRVQRGQQKGGGFAATGLAGHHPVTAREGVGNGLQLNGGRLGVAELGNRLQQRRIQAQRGKAGQRCELNASVVVEVGKILGSINVRQRQIRRRVDVIFGIVLVLQTHVYSCGNTMHKTSRVAATFKKK